MPKKVPNWENAEIPKAKVVDYLLSKSHRDGRFKADFFTRLGFSAGAWEDLAQAFRKHLVENSVANAVPSPFGVRYVVEGIMESPSGKTALVRSVWFIEENGEIPRLATAYPIRERKRS